MFRAHRPILRRVHTAVHTTIGSVSVLLWPCALYVVHIQSTRPKQYRHWTNGCVNSCVNSPEDGLVGPKHIEIRQYINKIEIVTSIGFYSICWKDARYKNLRFFLLAKGSTQTLKLTQLPLLTGIEECLTQGTAVGMRSCLIIPISVQHKG